MFVLGPNADCCSTQREGNEFDEKGKTEGSGRIAAEGLLGVPHWELHWLNNTSRSLFRYLRGQNTEEEGLATQPKTD